jgi:hypothetical protein
MIISRRKEKFTTHLSKGNNYGEKSHIACVPSRLKLPKGHTWTFSLREITCPLCCEAKIYELKARIADLRRIQKENKHRIDKCQKNFQVEIKRLAPFVPDPEMLERIRAGV